LTGVDQLLKDSAQPGALAGGKSRLVEGWAWRRLIPPSQVSIAAAEARRPFAGAWVGGAMITRQRVCLITRWATERIQELHRTGVVGPPPRQPLTRSSAYSQEARAGDAVGVSMIYRSNALLSSHRRCFDHDRHIIGRQVMTSKSQYRTATDLWCSGLDIAPNRPVAAHRCRLAVSLPRVR
jgi:hypothetical protein